MNIRKIKLLDCTLRDGGYINDWRFGENAVDEITRAIISSGIDIFEIGFLKDEAYQKDRTVYNSVGQISEIIKPKKKDTLYAGMIEVVNPLPLDRLDKCTDDTIDIIRVIVWKRLLKEGFEYCKGVIDKGYKLCIQPARVDQYNTEEFIEMIRLFNQIKPMAVYVVDSFGTQNKKSLMRYFELADRELRQDIALGYHGHNNLMQAFGVADAFVERNFDRDIIIDGSIYGMGRGAGNLNIEIFAKYMNDTFNTPYKIEPFLEVYEKYLVSIYNESPWGYSIPLYLCALHRCNPMYGTYYGYDLKLDAVLIDSILKILSEDDKIQFQRKTAEHYLNKILQKNEL